MLARSCLLVAASAAFALSIGSGAFAASTDWIGDSHTAVRLITATDNLGAVGMLDAGLEFRFSDGWHGYWRTPGDAGVAPAMDWSNSENIARSEVAWPAPHRLVIEGLQNSVYQNHVVLPVKLFLKHVAIPARVQVSITYAACSEVCVPYRAELTLQLPIGAGASSSEAAAIDSARKTVPGTAAAAGIDITRIGITGTASGPILVVDLWSKGESFVHPDLFVEGIGDGIPAAPEVDLQEGGRTARLSVQLPAPLPSDRRVTATLTDGDRAVAFSVPTFTTFSADDGTGARTR